MLLKNLKEINFYYQEEKNKAQDLYHQMEFRDEWKNHIIPYYSLDLTLYFNDYPFDFDKRSFENPVLTSWKMDKKIKTNTPSKNLKISDYLP